MNITTEVYTSREDVHYVKAYLADLGMYIAGITVRPSPKYEGLWVQMPHYFNPRNNSIKKYIEFESDSTFKKQLEQKCLAAIQEHNEAKLNINDKDFDAALASAGYWTLLSKSILLVGILIGIYIKLIAHIVLSI